jgi:hypothetical protein
MDRLLQSVSQSVSQSIDVAEHQVASHTLCDLMRHATTVEHTQNIGSQLL